MPRRTLFLLLRFAVAFGLLAWLAAVLPVYPWLEQPTVVAANALLRQDGADSRSLALVESDGRWFYVYTLGLGDQRRQLERPLHAHGFILLILASLALATPGLGARRLPMVVASGALFGLALCTLMLMSDVARWEAEQFPGGRGPYGIPLGFVAGLHRTAAAGLLPVVLWVLLAVRPADRRA